MKKLLRTIKSHIAPFKHRIFNRPRALKQLGNKSIVVRPWRFEGPDYVEIGSHTLIQGGSNICAVSHYQDFSYAPSIRIGDNVYIGHFAFITAIGEISIRDGCVLSEHVYITDFFHGLNPQNGLIMRQPLDTKGPVHIGPNCFLGYRVAVMPGVTLGEWCIVGANSVVTKSFPAYSMIAGAPARLVKVYSHELEQWVAPPANLA